MRTFLSILLLAGLLPAAACAQRDAAPRTDVAVAAADSVYAGAHMRFDETSHDFGDIARRGGDVEYTFWFTNDGSQPLVILKVLTSCTCTKAYYSKRPVAPGERASVRIVYEPHKKEPGSFSKVIQIFSTSVEGRNLVTIRGNSIDVKKL